jgi:Subtilase family
MKFCSLLTGLLLICLAVDAQTPPPTAKPETKLGKRLTKLATAYQQNSQFVLSATDNKLLTVNQTTGRVLVNAIAETDTTALQAELRKAGAEVVSSYGRIVTAWVSLSLLPSLDKLNNCRSIQPAYRARHRTGPVNSQGDAGQRSDLARTKFGVTGKDVKVGVLSDSYNVLAGAATGVSTGELPGIGNPNGYTTTVTVVKDYTATDGTDEGRAMLEIVHDVAPGASLAFYTAFVSPTDFANGIQQLANIGCKVIIDDVGYFDQPFFQDGIIAQSVDNVKANNGVAYFSAAGNSANASYESAYKASTFNPFSFAATAHNFGTNAAPIYYLPIQIPGNSSTILGFQWDDPFFSVSGGTGAQGDLDIYLLNKIPTTFPIASSIIVATSDDLNIGADALEILGYDNPSAAAKTFYVLITKYAGTAPTRLKFVENADSVFPVSSLSIVGVGASTCYGHPNAAGAIAAGAAPFDKTPAYGVNPPQAESFSSKGGTPIYFTTTGTRLPSPVTRQKPDITAPDGGNTSFFYSDSSIDIDTYPNFFGTSAAAPHAGAVAALMIDGRKTITPTLPVLTPTDVKTALIASCVDMDDPTTAGFDVGFDYGTGYGLIRADVAVHIAVRAICSSLSTAIWNSQTTWDCGYVPLITTPITISSNHIVTIDGFTAKAQKVKYSGAGKLKFLNNGKLSFIP